MFLISQEALEYVYYGYMGKSDVAKRERLMEYHRMNQPALMMYYFRMLTEFQGPYRGPPLLVMLAISTEHANGTCIPLASTAMCRAAAEEYERCDARTTAPEWERYYAHTQPELLTFMRGETVLQRMGLPPENDDLRLSALRATLVMLRPFEF